MINNLMYSLHIAVLEFNECIVQYFFLYNLFKK